MTETPTVTMDHTARRAEMELKMVNRFVDRMTKSIKKASASGQPCPYCSATTGHDENCKYKKMKEVLDG